MATTRATAFWPTERDPRLTFSPADEHAEHRDTPDPSCELCAEDAAELDDPCRFCGETDAHPDDVNGLCNQCATEMAYDRAELAGEDHRVGLCCSNAHDCGGLCDRGSH